MRLRGVPRRSPRRVTKSSATLHQPVFLLSQSRKREPVVVRTEFFEFLRILILSVLSSFVLRNTAFFAPKSAIFPSFGVHVFGGGKCDCGMKYLQ